MASTTQGAQQKEFLVEPIAEDGTPTFDGSSGIFGYLSESMRKTESQYVPEVIRGTRGEFATSTREGTYAVAGDIVLTPNKDDLDFWLPYIMGGGSGGTWTVAETLPWFAMLMDKLGALGGSTYFKFGSCLISRATFSASVNEPLKLTLSIMAKTMTAGTAWAGTPPTISDAQVDYQPFMFHDLAMTLGGSTQSVYDFTATLDNVLEVKYGSGSASATSITPTKRIVTVGCTLPWGATEKTNIYDQAQAGAAGVATFTKGGDAGPADTFVMTFGTLQHDANATPVVSGKTEVPYPVQFTARKPDLATAELACATTNGA